MEENPNLSSQQKTATFTTNLKLPLVFIGIILLALVGIGSYFLGQQSKVQQTKVLTDISPTSQPPQDNNSLLQRIEKVYTFKNSQGIIKKIIFLTKSSNPNIYGYQVYLTNDLLDISSGVELFKTEYSLAGYNAHFPNSQKKDKFVLEFKNQGDSFPNLMLFNDEGKVLKKEMIDFDPSEIAYKEMRKTNPKAGGSLGIESIGFEYRTDIFKLKIINALGEEFIVDIDGNTGNYIKGSEQKVK